MQVLPEERNCTFVTFGIYEKGFCTFYGACRIENKDYMYQGGCERESQWGEKVITQKNVSCRVWNAESATISFGQCNSDGKCVKMKNTNATVSVNSPECAAYKMFQNQNLTIQRRLTPGKVEQCIRFKFQAGILKDHLKQENTLLYSSWNLSMLTSWNKFTTF